MNARQRTRVRLWAAGLLLLGWFPLGVGGHTAAQTEQRVEVTIKDHSYISRQSALIPGVATVISIKNEDDVRHDFGSFVFQGSMAQVNSNGVISYGRGLEGVFIDPSRSATIHFMAERPGRYEFRCSIHPNMRGELLLLNIGAA